MKPVIIQNQKQVARVIANAKRTSIYNAIKMLEDDGIEKYIYTYFQSLNRLSISDF